MTNQEYDSPWKEAIENYFQEFLEFFFPLAAQGINWQRGYNFLDKELQQIAPDAEIGRRYVDKLVQVWQNDGSEKWVLIHIEVQSYEESNFAERMFIYHYRLFDRYNRSIASFAILGDERLNWKPNTYSHELWGCKLTFEFPIVKLLEFQQRWAELEASNNPFATVVMAHLKAKATYQNDPERKQWKLYLTKRLYERGYRRPEIINLFRFIDWVMQLPPELEIGFRKEISQYEEEKTMRYVTSIERLAKQEAIEEGLQEGLQQGLQQGLIGAIELGLELKFGSEGLQLLSEISQIQNLEVLEAIKTKIKTANNPGEIQQIYQ